MFFHSDQQARTSGISVRARKVSMSRMEDQSHRRSATRRVDESTKLACRLLLLQSGCDFLGEAFSFFFGLLSCFVMKLEYLSLLFLYGKIKHRCFLRHFVESIKSDCSFTRTTDALEAWRKINSINNFCFSCYVYNLKMNVYGVCNDWFRGSVYFVRAVVSFIVSYTENQFFLSSSQVLTQDYAVFLSVRYVKKNRKDKVYSTIIIRKSHTYTNKKHSTRIINIER